MHERPYSRYSREKTWAALYSQHIAACYALVPYSLTNNSIAVIRCSSPQETAATARELLTMAQECDRFYTGQEPPEQAPALLQRARHAVVLARSSDYYRYHLADHPQFRLVICGLHDSYLHLVVWETSTNRRYEARQTRLAIAAPEFASARMTPTGHSILLGALFCGDQQALAYLSTLPERTQRRIKHEVRILQETRYRGRPLAFLTAAQRAEVGHKISQGLRRYHARWHA